MATADIDLRRYLLGQLSGEAAADLEAAYFDDDALRARIEREEELLIEAYLLETLDASTRSPGGKLFALGHWGIWPTEPNQLRYRFFRWRKIRRIPESPA